MQRVSWLNTILRDVLYALRQFVRNPLFTMVAVSSLAIGIGANTAIFSVMDAALLKALPVANPQELVIFTDPNASGVTTGLNTGERHLMTFAEFAQLRDHATTLSGMFATEADLNRWHVRIGGGLTEEARGRLVSEEYFSVLGLQPAIGRFFTSSDAKGPGQDPYAVISYDYWQSRFGGKQVLGTPIQVGNANLTVIAVANAGFRGETVGESTDFWMPVMMQPIVIPGREWLSENLSQSADKVMWLHTFGRLKPGLSSSKAQTEINVLFRQVLENSYPTALSPELRRQALDQRLVLHEARTGVFANKDDFSQQLFLLLAAAIVVLAIACINVANLLLARGSNRSREVALRLSIGATRARIVRQFLTESLVLSFLGGLLALLLAWGASRLLIIFLASGSNGLELTPTLDGKVLSFTLFAVVLSGIIFGLAPALRGTNIDLNNSLRDSGHATASTRKVKLTQGLVVCQIGLSLLAVILAGLFLRTIWNLQSVGLGYPKEKLLLITVDGVRAGYKGPQLSNLWRDLNARLQALPGVQAVSYSINGLFSGSEADDEIAVEGFTPQNEDEKTSRFDMVGPGYFSTLGVPLLRGRELGLSDGPSAPHVAVINEAFANRFFAGRNPVGRHITQDPGSQKNIMEVVGVAGNVRDHALRGEVPPRFYVPGDQAMGGPNEWATFEIRVASDPKYMLDAVRKTIVNADSKLYPAKEHALVESLESSMSQPRMIARLCAVFGTVGLLLAAGGLYGVLSYGIARRTNEIGIRMALGAAPGRVIGMVLWETGMMLAVGAVLGIVLTFACTRLINGRLYGLSTLDPLTILSAIGLFAVVAAIAALVPAARAARVNPITALRHE
ncbi:MAG TPA: ABC transporter permease [Candidatus Angelobacter sp.]|nr:ABC transporter permease [Candidatus Angelobacter sp.]